MKIFVNSFPNHSTKSNLKSGINSKNRKKINLPDYSRNLFSNKKSLSPQREIKKSNLKSTRHYPIKIFKERKYIFKGLPDALVSLVHPIQKIVKISSNDSETVLDHLEILTSTTNNTFSEKMISLSQKTVMKLMFSKWKKLIYECIVCKCLICKKEYSKNCDNPRCDCKNEKLQKLYCWKCANKTFNKLKG